MKRKKVFWGKVWTVIDNCNCHQSRLLTPRPDMGPSIQAPAQQSVIKETPVARFLLCTTFSYFCVTPFFMKFTLPSIVQSHPHRHKDQTFFFTYMIRTISDLHLSSRDTWQNGKGILCDLIMSCCNCQYFVIWTYDEPLPIRILIHHYAYWRPRARKHKQINPPDREYKKQS